MLQALGYTVSEEVVLDDKGRPVNPRFDQYRIFRADEAPAMRTIFVETYEASGPFGAKSVAEIAVDGVGSAVANAVRDAVNARVRVGPLYPERVWQAMQEQR
jgi:CO/xanthine dehydrogenase Mo-binding subunit